MIFIWADSDESSKEISCRAQTSRLQCRVLHHNTMSMAAA
jgi:hypothetical protein